MLSTMGLFILFFISLFVVFGLNLEGHNTFLGIITTLVFFYLITILIIVIASGNVGGINLAYWFWYSVDFLLYGLSSFVSIVEVSSSLEDVPRTKEFYEIDKKSLKRNNGINPIDLEEKKKR